ncbi:hypothetical protein [Acinetobacter variabilis]|uniref:hypothetical protein n=1 Tax=Acinetobacter variabilis TaxID=70346 RepID=UPI0030FC8925
MKSTADLVKIYDQNCVTQENEACSQLGASILEKFKNPEFTESAINYLMLKTHPKVENYNRPLAKVVIASSSGLPVQRLS